MLITSLLFLLSSSTTHAAIFGVDDRVSVTPSSVFNQWGRSTAIAVLSANVETNPNGSLRILADKATNLCSSEKFSKELNLSYACSGFLVGPDLIATAGHCMVNFGETRNEPKMYCEAFHWLFDYQLDSNNQIDYNNIPSKNLYRCKEVIYAVKDDKAPFRDYALVRLERKVEGRTPLKMATLKSGEQVSMMGYPLGLSLKRSAPANVLLNNPQRTSFITSLDAFEGNSGSAVFNSKHEVVGILVGGTPSEGMIPANGRNCDVYNRCNDQGNGCVKPDADSRVFAEFQRVGSEVQRIAPIQDLVKQLSR